MTLFAPQLEVGMRLFFICAYAVAVFADLYAHIRMKPHRKICIVYVDIRMRINCICSYEKSTQVCHPIRLMILKKLIVQILSAHLFEVMI